MNGAGIAGLSLAYGLARRGHRPVVLEQSPRPRGGGYMIDFFGPGYDTAERLGLLPDLERIHYPIERLAFVDEAGRERYHFRYRDARRMFRDRHFNFLRGDLERVLFEKVRDLADVRFGTGVARYLSDGDRVHAHLTDGSAVECDLLVGAGGIHSHVRELTFGPEERFLRYLGYHAIAFFIDRALATPLPADGFATLTLPGRQVSVYPVPGGLATLFLHRREKPIADRSRSAALSELRIVYDDLGWVVPELLERAAAVEELYFDDVAQVELPQWASGRVTLVGDACQCVSLVAGVGASLAMTGADVLAERLDSAVGVPEALAGYIARMKPAAESHQAAGRRTATWFVPKDRFGVLVRDLIARAAFWPVTGPILQRWLVSQAKL